MTDIYKKKKSNNQAVYIKQNFCLTGEVINIHSIQRS